MGRPWIPAAVTPEFQRPILRRNLARLAGGVAHGEIAEHEARDRRVLDDILRIAHQDGWKDVGLDMTRGEAGGLVAH